jgi:eukaryotic-like serine/threonine-protein kinase
VPIHSDEPTLHDRPRAVPEPPASDTLRDRQARIDDAQPLSVRAGFDASGQHASDVRSAASDSAQLTETVAIRDEQAARGQAIVWIGLVGAGLMAIAIQIPEERPPGHLLTSIALTFASVMSGAILLLSRRRAGVDSQKVFALGVVTTLAILTVLYYAGPFSPASLALFLGIYYFGLGDSRAQAWIMFTLCTGGFVLLGLAATVQAFDIERTMLPVTDVGPVVRLVTTAVVASFLTFTFWLARLSRAATLRAISQLESARRQLRQREALLDEARADLNHVLDAGRMGRFTGRSVGPYRLDEIVGRGAMGEVYAAVDTRDSSLAAVKLLHPYVLEEPMHVQRFFREAEVASSLASPHIVRVLTNGFSDDGSPFIAMERLIGHDLAWHLRERRRLRLKDVLDLVSQVSQALAIAQDAEIVHRDLKPQNLFLNETGAQRLWKVLDFGVSKIASIASTLTQGAAVGTPSYMSPEQARGHDVDHRADIFGLGVIAYRCLTGRPAFTGADPLTTMYNVVHVQPARPGDHVPLHQDIELALALAIAKQRERRFPSAATFAAALRDASRGQLDDRLRRDARELLSDQPWGADDADRAQREGRRSSEGKKSHPELRASQTEILRRSP